MSDILNVTPDFYWVGALDPTLRTFDIVMETEFGTTYNAYLLKGSEGIALFETVKDKCFDKYLEKLKKIVALEDIKYIIVDHTEPDHAGSVAKLLPYTPNATVVGSALAIRFMSQIINAPFKSLVVKDGETLSLGNKTIRFLSVPQLHWPDTMYSYIEEDGLLITCDSFGAHYSDERIFKNALETDREADYESAYKYYFDMIMGPFKPFVLKALDKIKDLSIKFICPGHGMILDETNMQKYLDFYKTWSTPKALSPKIVVAYVSAYGYTKEMAETICKGIDASDYTGEVVLLNLETDSLADAMAHIETAEGLLLGSPTILADALPPIWNVLTSLNPVVHRHLTVGTFGSYGWSGEALPHIQERFKQLKCRIPLQPLACVFKLGETNLQEAFNFGKDFATTLVK
ncbi:FprA family A-type flavoprotein [Cellulosilyticum sp. ST5]|uniref:FprA family A-type flavoprotein n=1 Tax=Cellulosilyticum sp. ST5 TaxID=3055805 RepID=UPI003977923D